MSDDVSLIITSTRGKSWHLTVHRLWMILGVSAVSLCVVLLIGSVALNVALVQRHDGMIDHDQEQQHQVIQTLKSDVNALKHLIQDLLKKEEEMRQDLGKPRYRRLSKRRQIQRKINAFNKQFPNTNSDELSTHQLASEIHYLRQNTLKMEQSFRRYSKTMTQYRDWFESTPSIWPVYGYIRSNYGLRRHPIRRVKHFHKGIDIPAWTGAPVQATADGWVEFAGWAGGYGWMIVVAHDYGYQTLYAHLSEIDALQGLQVSKGQIIGKIGSSGLSTGPHVHYEIRHRRKPVNPNLYLDLDLFTAVSKLW